MIILIFALILAAYIGALIMALTVKKLDDDLEAFLNENADRLFNGEACEFNGTVYTRETRLVRYRYCVSVGIMTFTRSTCLALADSICATSVIAFLISLFGGWWGLPWGPIRTISSFIENARQEDAVSIAELLRVPYNC